MSPADASLATNTAKLCPHIRRYVRYAHRVLLHRLELLSSDVWCCSSPCMWSMLCSTGALVRYWCTRAISPRVCHDQVQCSRHRYIISRAYHGHHAWVNALLRSLMLIDAAACARVSSVHHPPLQCVCKHTRAVPSSSRRLRQQLDTLAPVA